jgi:hypothetical protein
MRQYDKFEQLALDAQLSVVILGNPETSDFEMVSVAPGPLPDERNIRARGMRFVGVVGLVHGVPRSALDEPLDAATTSALAQAYLRFIEHEANKELETAVLGRMYQLSDPRTN